MKATPFARQLARSASLATLGILLVAPSLTYRALAESALIGPVSSTVGAEVSPEVRQSWEEDYASLKVALRQRDNPHALLRPGEERKEVADLQSLYWESDRTPADVALRRTAALLEHLKQLPGAPDLEALEKELAAASSRHTGAVDDQALYFAVRRIGRAVALANPLLDFDSLIL
ncbi:MAG: hypothetical protein ACYC23_19425, partial [Limisphaerales bacterium]